MRRRAGWTLAGVEADLSVSLQQQPPPPLLPSAVHRHRRSRRATATTDFNHKPCDMAATYLNRIPVSPRVAVLALLATVLFLAATAEAQQQSRPKISDESLEYALNDKRYLTRQLKCVLNEAPCDPVGRRLRTLAPLVLRDACPQCTPDETRQIQRTLSHIQRHYPKEWIRIVKQYSGH